MNIEEVRNKFLENGYNLLTKTYKSNKDMLEFEKDGYIYYNSYNGFTRAYNPKKWSISNPYSIQNLNLFFKENGNTCRVLSKEYSGYYPGIIPMRIIRRNTTCFTYYTLMTNPQF